MDTQNNGCTACSIGTYSDTENAESCIDCPEDQITSQEGSTSGSQCFTGYLVLYSEQIVESSVNCFQ